MFCLELALAISEDSFGSSQIFFLPHFKTLAAKRFCSLSVLKAKKNLQNLKKYSKKTRNYNVT